MGRTTGDGRGSRESREGRESRASREAARERRLRASTDGAGACRAALVGLALGAIVLAAPAVAISPEPAAPPTGLPGIAQRHAEPGDPLYYFSAPAPPHAAEPVAFGPTPQLLVDPPPSIIGGFRSRRIKVIHYATPLRVAQSDMMLNLDAPGAGNAIISLELEFY